MLKMILRDPPPEKWLTKREAAKYLRTSETTIYRIMKEMEADPRYTGSILRWRQCTRISSKKLMRYLTRREKCG